MLTPNPYRSYLVCTKYGLKSIAFAFLVFFSAQVTDAQTYRSTGASTNWKDASAWTCQGGGCKDYPGTKLTGGAKIYIRDSIMLDENLQLINAQLFLEEDGILHLVNASLDIENNKNKGSLIGSHGKLHIDLAWTNRGIVEFENTIIEVGGNVNNQAQITFDSTCLYVQGNLSNAGEFKQQGFIRVFGDIDNQSSWSADLIYCLDGNLTGSVSANQDCEAGTFCPCLLQPCTIVNPDIEPGVNSVFKVDSVIGPFLTGLSEGLTQNGLQDDVFIFGPSDDVCVDIFVTDYAAVVALLSGTYGVTNFLPGSDNLVITTYFPIADLKELNERADIIQFVRATPVGRTNANSTLPNQGDFAQESFFTRTGYDLSGAGVKIGVLSDSYDKSEANGNQAASVDIQSGVLPGDPTVGSDNPTLVQVVQEFPGDASDEGRGMLQIVHSVAPGAELYFHTAFISPASFADGIRALRDAQCDVIVDDVTYITESFYGRGVVAKAVDEVTAQSGVNYLTSAGNFADRAFDGVFSATQGNKHNFQGGDFLQKLTLEPGDYLMVLQWDDKIFSIGEAGAEVDLDIYLADDNGNKLYGFNGNNLGKDPVEVMPFSVISQTATTTNLMIENGGPTNADGMPFKYVVFKAGGTNQGGFSAEYYQGGSTIVGHANTPSAMSVGAVRYSDTPTYGGTLKTESFSSVGLGSKPDFTAPDGGNVTINLGNDISGDADNLPNFFGTSAAAPHAAGICALLLEAQDKFGVSFDLRQKLITTAIAYGEPSSKMGAGFVSAFVAMESFANPNPSIERLDLTALGPDPSAGGTIVIEGSYFNDQTKVFIRDMELDIQSGSTDSTLIVVIPPYLGNPPIWVFNPALVNGDGGADTVYTTDPIIEDVAILTNTLTKKYGETIPELTFTTDNAALNSNAELLALLSDAVNLSTTASDTSSVGDYAILASWDESALDPALLELYSFTTGEVGFLSINPLALTIKPQPVTTVYGDAIPSIVFDYSFEAGVNVANEETLKAKLESDHQSSIAPDLAVLVNLSLANLSLANLSLANKAFLASLRSTLPNLSLANLSLANGMEIIEVDARLFNETSTSNLENGTSFIGNLSLVNFLSLANNRAYENGTGGDPELNLSLANLSLANLSLANYSQIENLSNLSLANLSLVNFLSLANLSLVNLSLANGTSVQDFSLPLRNFLSLANNDNTGMVTILTPADIGASSNERVPLVPVNFVTGLDAGDQKIVPAAFLSKQLSKNFIVSYEEGDLTILPAELTLTVADTSISYGESLPEFRVIDDELLLGDSLGELVDGFQISNGGTSFTGDAGTYQVSVNLVANGNYNVTVVEGTLSVGKTTLTVGVNPASRLFGEDNPSFNLNFSGFINNDGPADIDLLPTIETTADCNSDVGDYSTNPTAGTDNNYELIYSAGTLSIDPSTLTITAKDVIANEGQNISYSFETTTMICGNLVKNEVTDPAEIDGMLDRLLDGAGLYEITPVVTGFDDDNHVIELVSGTLFINPVVGCSDKIRASDLCQEDVQVTVDGIAYSTRLTFEYTNSLSIPIHIPLGSENKFKIKGNVQYQGDPPTRFEPGSHTFEVLTNGGDLQWQIKTPGCNNFDKSANGSNANACVGSASYARSVPLSQSLGIGINVYPNPFHERIQVIDSDQVKIKSTVRVISAAGRIVNQVNGADLATGIEINLDGVPAGIYYVQVMNGEESTLTKIIKM